MATRQSKPQTTTTWEARYDPALTPVRVLAAGDPALVDPAANIGCAYNPTGEMHMIARDTPAPQAGEVLIHVKATGICGSDVHFWKHGEIGSSKLVGEVCAGHESAGEIVAVGAGVADWKAGDRVAMEVGVPCGRPDCRFCLEGRYNQCPNMVFHSSPPYHGTLTRFITHPAAWCHRLPDTVSFEEGALIEPLAVALAGLERADVRLGDPVLVCPLVITDLVESRLEFAKKLVPDVAAVLVGRDTSPEVVAAQVRAAAGTPLKAAIECSGFEGSVTAAIYSVDVNGTVCVVGMGPKTQRYPFADVSFREIDLRFLFRYKHQYPRALRLVGARLIDVRPLVSHRFALADAVAAFTVAGDPTQGGVKVQILD